MTYGPLGKLTASILVCAALTPAVSAADPVNISQLDAASLRALFQTPEFTQVCPLTVYSEDYSIAHKPRHAARPQVNADRKQAALNPARFDVLRHPVPALPVAPIRLTNVEIHSAGH